MVVEIDDLVKFHDHKSVSAYNRLQKKISLTRAAVMDILNKVKFRKFDFVIEGQFRSLTFDWHNVQCDRANVGNKISSEFHHCNGIMGTQINFKVVSIGILELGKISIIHS